MIGRTTQLCFLVAFLAGLLSFPTDPLWAADAPAKPAEIKVLERLVGDWTTEATITVLDAQPQNLKTTGTATRKWELDGRIVEESGKSSNGEESKVIFAYDANKHGYRFVFLSSAGIIVDSAGSWNEATQTFSFQADLGNGFTQTSSIHFIGDDNHEWSSKVTDGTGKVWFEGGGKNKRKK